MNGPDFENHNLEATPGAPGTEFEQALARAMKHVEVPAETSAKLLALAEQAERKHAHAGSGLRLIKLTGGARIFSMPRMPQTRAWMSGAIAAVLAVGCFVGARLHTEHERKIVAQQEAQREFETAERITDQALERTREQLQQRGIRLEP